MLTFRKPALEDKALIDEFFKSPLAEGCEYTFANIYLWSSYYKVTFAVYNDTLIFKSGVDEQNNETQAFAFPIGKGDLKPAFEAMMEYAKEKGIPFQLYGVTEKMRVVLEELYPDQFVYTEDRDSADYIYNTEDLAELRGKKYHGKRNHINNFKLTDWNYEPLTADNMQECWEMNVAWCEENGCKENGSSEAEFCVIKNMFKSFDYFGLVGGVLRQNGKVVAFTVGEPVSDEVFVVHIEKAFSSVAGAYPTINQEFVRHAAMNYRYVNREEDMGLEGLRKAKLSYRPAILLTKYNVERKDG